MEKSPAEEDEINIISPIFYNYFKDNLDIGNPASDYLAKLKKLQGDLRILTFLHYEQELRDLSLALDKFDYPPDDKPLKAVFTLFHCLLYLCLGDKVEMTKYFRLIIYNDLPENNDLFLIIYNLVREYLEVEPTPNKLNIKIIVAREFNDLAFHLLKENINKTRYRYSYLIEDSQQNPNLHAIFSSNPYLFICGHGSDDSLDGGLKYHSHFDKFIRIKGDFIDIYKKNFKILALLSCGTKPYLNYKDGFEYFILSERTATPQLSEMFIKTFNLSYNETKNIKLSLKLGMASLFFHTDEKLAFSIYNYGVLLKL